MSNFFSFSSILNTKRIHKELQKRIQKELRKISYRQLDSGIYDFSPNYTDADGINKVEPDEELTPQVGYIVIVEYATKRKM